MGPPSLPPAMVVYRNAAMTPRIKMVISPPPPPPEATTGPPKPPPYMPGAPYMPKELTTTGGEVLVKEGADLRPVQQGVMYWWL